MPLTKDKTDESDKVLYFTKSFVATADEVAEANTLQGRVVFRNARFIKLNQPPESCSAVAGAVPSSYSHLPMAKKAGASKKVQPSQPKAAIQPPAGAVTAQGGAE